MTEVRSQQVASPRRTCGTMTVHHHLLATDAQYLATRNQLENRLWAAVRSSDPADLRVQFVLAESHRNYMDYVDDAAMVMFTEGQMVRMQATLTGARAALGASPAAT